MKNLIILVTLFIVGSFFYLLTLKGVPGNPTPLAIKENLSKATKPLELSPERGRYILVYSLAENKSFALSNELGEVAAPDVGVHGGKYYIYFGPGVSILALPLYLIGKNYNFAQVFTFSTIAIFASLNLLVIYLIARNIFRLPTWASLLASFLFGFGSTAWSYAITLYQHQVTTFFILSSFYAIWKYRQGKKHEWLWALYVWTVIGYSIFVDYPNAILMLPVMLFFLISSFLINIGSQKVKIVWRSSYLITSIAFISIMFIHGYYNYVHFGDWKKLSAEIEGYKQIQKEKLLISKSREEKIKTLANKKSVSGFFKEENMPRGLAILLFSRDRGIFLYAPIFILAILGIIALAPKSSAEIISFLFFIAVNIFLYSSWGDPWGGWAYGPRYLIPSMAILSIFVCAWLTKAKRLLLSKISTLILFAYSSFIALLGALTTSQVPPKVEADFLKMKYNFLLNWDYFIDGKSGSFIFNEFAAKYLTLQKYFLAIYIPLLLIVFYLLFIAPKFEKK